MAWIRSGKLVTDDTDVRCVAAIRSAWCARSCRVARSTARRVRTIPSPMVSAMPIKTTAAIARNSLERRRPRVGWSGRDAISGRDELVARAAHRPDPVGVAELAPELRHVHVDGAGPARIRHAPDEVEQAFPGEDDAGVLEEAGEQVELLARQLDRPAGDRHLAGVAAQHDLARRQHLVLDAPLGAAEDRLDPGGELARRERLRDVVVRAELEAGDPVRLLVAGGEHHDRHLRAGADPAADLEGVDAGQAEGEGEHAHGLVTQLGQRLLAAAQPDHAPAVLLLEVLLDQSPDRVVVLHEQEGAARCPDRHALRIGAAQDRGGRARAVCRPPWLPPFPRPPRVSTCTSSAGPFAGQVTRTRQPWPSVLGEKTRPKPTIRVEAASAIGCTRPSASRRVSCEALRSEPEREVERHERSGKEQKPPAAHAPIVGPHPVSRGKGAVNQVSVYSGPDPPSGGVSRPPLAPIAPHCTQFAGDISTSTVPSPSSGPISYTCAGHIRTHSSATSRGTRRSIRMWFGWSSRVLLPEAKTEESLSNVRRPSGAG